MEATVTIDGKAVTFRATAAVPRLYRIKFHRDLIQDMKIIADAVKTSESAKRENGEVSTSSIPMEALTMFENMAYIMAKHGDPSIVEKDPGEWLDGFNTMSIYNVFPVIQALWEGNMASLVEAKKKLELSTAK